MKAHGADPQPAPKGRHCVLSAGKLSLGTLLSRLLGGALQLAIQIPPLLQHRIAVAFRVTLRDPRLRRIDALMPPGVLGMGVAEINAFVDTFLASLLPPGSVASLEYGHRVMQLPLAALVAPAERLGLVEIFAPSWGDFPLSPRGSPGL